MTSLVPDGVVVIACDRLWSPSSAPRAAGPRRTPISGNSATAYGQRRHWSSNSRLRRGRGSRSTPRDRLAAAKPPPDRPRAPRSPRGRARHLRADPADRDGPGRPRLFGSRPRRSVRPARRNRGCVTRATAAIFFSVVGNIPSTSSCGSGSRHRARAVLDSRALGDPVPADAVRGVRRLPRQHTRPAGRGHRRVTALACAVGDPAAAKPTSQARGPVVPARGAWRGS